MTAHYHARKAKPKGACEKCGSKRNVDVHHRDGNWRNNDPKNLGRLCRKCHYHHHNPEKHCSIPNCKGIHKGRGYCEKHYQRFRKWGDPLLFKRNQYMKLVSKLD